MIKRRTTLKNLKMDLTKLCLPLNALIHSKYFVLHDSFVSRGSEDIEQFYLYFVSYLHKT